MDADDQHDPADIPSLLAKLDNGYDMVLGARSTHTQASSLRRLGNGFYNRFASMMTGHKIEDVTSGFRVVRAEKFRKFLYLLANGFSYPPEAQQTFTVAKRIADNSWLNYSSFIQDISAKLTKTIKVIKSE